jgi:hypothetical protein
MSGVVALHLGTGPIRKLDDDDIRRAAAEAPTFELGASGAPGLPPTFASLPPPFASPASVPPGSTLPDLPRQPMTVPGLAPPPIPVPQGVNGPPTSPLSPPMGGTSTLLGMGKAPPAIPSIKPRPTLPSIPRTETRPGTRPGTANDAITIEPAGPQFRVAQDGVHTLDPKDLVALDGGIGDAVELDAIDDHDDYATPVPPAAPSILSPPREPSGPSLEPPPPAPEPGRTMIGVAVQPRAETDGEESPMDTLSGMALEELRTAAAEPPSGRITIPPPFAAEPLPSPPAFDGPPTTREPAVPLAPPPHAHAPAAPLPPGWMSSPSATPSLRAPFSTAAQPRRGRGPVLGLIAAAILGVAAWQIYAHVGSSDATPRVVANKPNAPAANPPPTAPPPSPAATPPADAAVVVTAPPVDARGKLATVAIDAGTTAPTPAAIKAPIKPAAPDAGPNDTLAIASTPPGARVFLDGSDAGTTPAKLAGSPDRHSMALLLAGHELYVAQVDGHGTFSVPLKEVTPTNGPAGIKVMRCKDKDRYYVFVDGKPTGQSCPTERIGCEIGPHTVEVYDVVSETRRKWDIVVKDTRLSFRVRVE